MNEDSRKERSNTDGRDGSGRFAAGNPGKPRGTRNRMSAAAEAIVDDGVGDVAQKCVEMAKAGDVGCIRALLRLRIPALRERSVQQPIELPKLETAQDTLQGIEAAARAEIDADQARALTAVVTAFQQAFQIVDLDERIGALETAHAKEDGREAA